MSKADEEKKSYASVFLLAVALLLVGGIWVMWDDQISRRPWKKYQYDFSKVQIEQARDAVEAEEKRLEELADYQKVVEGLAEARQQNSGGETGRVLSELESREQSARIAFDEAEFNLRVVKSKIEEAWYEYEHAILHHGDTESTKAHLEELEEEKTRDEEQVAEKQARLNQILNERKEIESVVLTLEKEKEALESDKSRLEQKLDGLVMLKLGPVELPKIPKIEQIVLNEFDRNAYNQPVARVDRCTSCHAGINKAGFEDQPHPFKTHPDRKLYLGTHDVGKLGCTPCHQGQGAAVNSPEQAHGHVKHWLDPMYDGNDVQASCIGCHADVRLDSADKIALGEKLFEQVGCVGCHLVEGYGDLPKIGPYLRRISAKVDADWLVGWVKNPHEFRPNTKMPNFYFDDAEARAIAGYLLSSSAEESQEWLEGHGAPTGVNPNNRALVAQGEELANSLGCRGCHGLAPGESPALLGDTKDVAPNLSNVAEKTNPRWTFHWLKNPRGYSPEARMPSLRLSDAEARALVSYLMTLGQKAGDDSATRAELLEPENVATGEGLVRKYGCAGCHNIAGMEGESRIGVELSVFGSKPLEELFFGNRTDIPHTWRDWTFNKINEPRIYETERIEQVMPHFDLSETDIDAILVFLASRQEGKVPDSYRPASIETERTLVEGRRVIEQYNCVGCHVIGGKGGAILANYEENPTLGPPILTGEGAKVQANWLYGFLQRPIPLRPWLKVRMPTFGLNDEETAAIVRYFAAESGVENPFVHLDLASLSPEYVEAGKKLASDDYFSCFTCHQQGDKKPEGPEEGWAPDLGLAATRLNPDWIVDWIRDPQALQENTRMPSFYDFSDDSPDGPDDILGGSDEEQVKALRDYILTLHQPIPMAAPAAPPLAIESEAPVASVDEPSEDTAATVVEVEADVQAQG